MGLLVQSSYAPTCLHTAIHISGWCDFWHCHPYILLHFWKMFCVLVCVHSLQEYTKRECVFASFCLEFSKQVNDHNNYTTCQGWRYEGREEPDHFEVWELSLSKNS